MRWCRLFFTAATGAVVALMVVVPPAIQAQDSDPKRWLGYKALKGSIRVTDAGKPPTPSDVDLLFKQGPTRFRLDATFELTQTKEQPGDAYFQETEFTGRLNGNVSYESRSTAGDKEAELRTESGCRAVLEPDSLIKLKINYGAGTYIFEVTASAQCAKTRMELSNPIDGTTATDRERPALFTVSPALKLFATNSTLRLPRSGKAFSGTSAVDIIPNVGIFDLLFDGAAAWWIESAPSDLAMEACPQLAVSQQGKVTARGEPPGGRCSFSIDPSSVARVAARDCAATVTAVTPGRATLQVEYVAPTGTRSRASQDVSVVRVESINQGRVPPRIALFDRDVRLKPATLAVETVPVSVQPPGSGEALTYALSNPAVLTAVPRGDAALLQALSVGTTTLQASTSCGGPTGPVATVEVIRCDDETLRTLDEQLRIAQQAAADARRDYHAVTDGDGFQGAAARISSSTVELAKTTSTLIVDLEAARGGRGSAAAKAGMWWAYGEKILDATNVLLTGEGDWESLVREAIAGAAEGTEKLGKVGELAGPVNDAFEVLKAAEQFGQDLGELLAATVRLDEAAKRQDNFNRVIQDNAAKRIACKGGGEPSPPPDQVEPRTRSGPRKEQQAPDATSSGSLAPDEPTMPPADQDFATGEDEGDEVSPPPPEPPPPPPVRVGLPYSSDNRGCRKVPTPNTASLPATAPLDVDQALRSLGRYVGEFASGPLTAYRHTLEGWSPALGGIKAALDAPAAERKPRMANAVRKLASIVDGTRAFDQASREFLSEFETCPIAIREGIDVLKAGPAVLPLGTASSGAAVR